ncbi:MAG TPA: methylmalonyl Co-A mutase-associated GTPase MeaB [Bacteroidia bacterium]|jgi:LAO/AO transport system kinase
MNDILPAIQNGDARALARAITLVENELPGYQELLSSLSFEKNIPVIGITGPPGAGKSTLINALLKHLVSLGKKTGIIAIDPTSPFNYGSLLGDRLRMAEHFNNEQVFIRSLATRGSLGGLSAKTIEIVDVMKNADLDLVIVETVGVGQSEVEIVGLADLTVLVLVPESGDEVQTLKSGVMEIADIYVVNKADRAGADAFIKNIITLVQSKHSEKEIPVIRAVAAQDEGIAELYAAIETLYPQKKNDKRSFLLAEKAFHLLQNKRMKDISRASLREQIEKASREKNFNLYRWIRGL